MTQRVRDRESQLHERLARAGLRATRWSNEPHAVYGVHDHPYAKVLVVVEGSITFTLARPGMGDARRAVESTSRRVPMKPGDRLELAAQTPHSAVVGPEGVVCLEAHLDVDQADRT